MVEINKLDDKYLVLKIDDISERLTEYGQRQLNQLVDDINSDRKQDGKNIQKYVVLNLDDEANIDFLISRLVSHTRRLTTPYIPIKDIGVDLVNAILIAGNP